MRIREGLLLAATGVIGTFLVLGAAEAALRAVGYGHSTGFFMNRTDDGRECKVTNRAFYQQFSGLPIDRIMTWDDLDFQVPVTKADGAVRVFVFGSSAIYGPQTSSRILEVMLREAAPDVRWEFYNAACPGMNSNTMWAAARACARMQPDLFLIYMGNNEAVGPYGPTTSLGQHPLLWQMPVIHTLIAMSDLRLFQWAGGSGPNPWLVPDKTALDMMAPGLTQNGTAIAHYRANLEAMCGAGVSAGARVVLCTLSGNRRLGGVAKPETQQPESVPTINRTVRSVAMRHAANGVALCDVEAALAAASPDGLPGYDYFCDNVHFTFDGNYVAARAMYDAVRVIIAPPARSAAPSLSEIPADREDCAKRLAWTPATEFELLENRMRAHFDDYSAQIIRARHGELAPLVGPDWKQRLTDDWRTAANLTPGDRLVRQKLTKALLDVNRPAEALAEAQKLRAEFPVSRAAMRLLAEALQASSDTAGAQKAYRELLAVYPDDPDGIRELAALCADKKDWAEAERLYRSYVTDYDPMDANALCGLARALAALKRPGEAERACRTAIERAPRFSPAYRELDAILTASMSPEQRAALWRRAAEKQPGLAAPIFQLGEALAAAGNWRDAAQAYADAERGDPHDHMIPLQLGRALEKAGDHAGAVTALRRAITISPRFAGYARVELMEILLAMGDTQGAREELRHCAEDGMAVPQALAARVDGAPALPGAVN
jgi:tetratricopeptide (TPR) repeat protein